MKNEPIYKSLEEARGKSPDQGWIYRNILPLDFDAVSRLCELGEFVEIHFTGMTFSDDPASTVFMLYRGDVERLDGRNHLICRDGFKTRVYVERTSFNSCVALFREL
jgi:hypothetical protein